MESNFFVRSVMRMIGCGSVEPETELLTLYQGVTYTTFAALGGAWPAATPKSSTEITTCAPHEENRRQSRGRCPRWKHNVL